MKLLTASLIGLIFTGNCVAQSWNHGDRPFNANVPRINETVSIEWRLVDNPTKACDEISKEYGLGGLNGVKADACAFWGDGNKCTIVTKKKPTMHDVGHEVRHCFYGEWH